MRNLIVGGAAAAVACVILQGCSSDDSRPKVTDLEVEGGAPAEAGAADGSTQTECMSDVASQCTGLLNCAPQIPTINVDRDAPTPTGGKIANGIYYISRYDIYTGAKGAKGAAGGWFRETFRFTDTLVELASASNLSALTKYTMTLSYDDATTSIVLDYDCPTARQLKVKYSVAADNRSFLLFYSANTIAQYTKID